MIPEKKAVRNMWEIFLVSRAMNNYTFLVDHEIDAPGTEQWLWNRSV
jgi:hypothetical protein